MSEITKTKDQKPKTKNQIFWLLIALIIIFIYFFGLNIPLLGPDEPRYTQIAREMFERGDWITPKLGGFDWFEKPALLYWLQIFFFKLFGISEFTARIGSALFGLGTIFSLWLLGKNYPQINTDEDRFENENPKTKDQKPKTDFANYLALIAASSIGLIAFSRGASFDIILTFPITASLVGFFIWETRDCKSQIANRKYLVAFYFFIGVSIIAKGLVGIVFPFAIVAFYYVLSWRLPNKTFIFSLVWGTILSILVACVWYVPMYQVNGWKFIDEFFIQHHFQRYTSNKYQHPQPFWFFFAVLPLMTTPWIPFFFAGIWKVLKEGFQRKDAKTQRNKFLFFPFSSSPLLLFSFAWLLVPLVFFSVSGSKLPGYILPALPGALILTAIYVYEFVQKSEMRDRIIKGTALATFLIVAILLQFFVTDYASHETVKNIIQTANDKGFSTERIVNLYTVSHNLEFYAPNRLVRDADGKLKKYEDFSVLVKENQGQILVLAPLKDVPNLLKQQDIAEISTVSENGESALLLVKSK
ncbi:MAG TPA: glycosyltransferase family 39 protein [Pyrinomonadaceae bacterium]|nr:glycosyltransferase family 39 protein [Pyrinomonadaceae bacterium]